MTFADTLKEIQETGALTKEHQIKNAIKSYDKVLKMFAFENRTKRETSFPISNFMLTYLDDQYHSCKLHTSLLLDLKEHYEKEGLKIYYTYDPDTGNGFIEFKW